MILERDFTIFPRDSLVWRFVSRMRLVACGSMCAHRFLIWKYSTHNLKLIILTIRLLLRQPGAGSSVVCFSKDVKVQLKVRRTLSSVGTSSLNIHIYSTKVTSKCPSTDSQSISWPSFFIIITCSFFRNVIISISIINIYLPVIFIALLTLFFLGK